MSNLLFLDLETTGVDTNVCEVIEYFFWNSHSSYIKGDLCKPKNSIPYDVSGVTNIDNYMVENLQAFEDQVKELKIPTNNIAVSHNTDFDLEVLKRYGVEFKKSICTYKLAWYLLPDLPNHKLGTLRAYFNVKIPTEYKLHRAEADVFVLREVYKKLWLLARMDKKKGSLSEAENEFVELSKKADQEFNKIWQFGKYKGQKIDESQSSYIQWAIQNIPDLKPKFKNNLLKYV